MEYLWLIYWGMLLLSIIFGFVVMIKKNKLTGLLEIILSLIIPIWAFVFALKRDYLKNGYSENEIKFLYDQIITGNMEAIIIILLFLVLILIMLYNIFLFNTEKKKIVIKM